MPQSYMPNIIQIIVAKKNNPNQSAWKFYHCLAKCNSV